MPREHQRLAAHRQVDRPQHRPDGALDPDPRLVVASYRTGEGYVYMCHSCARSFGERLQAARWAAQAVTVP